MYSKMRSDYTLMEHAGVEGKKILNVGCSFPVDEIYYARKVEEWISVDISRESLLAAREIVDEELHPDLAGKFEFRYADATRLPFDDATFDLSISMSTFDHLPTPEARQGAVDEMARTTRSGGHVIVTVANWWCLPYAAGIWKMSRDKTLHYGYAYLFSPLEIRKIGRRAGLTPVRFASSISPPDVWLPGYPRESFGVSRPLGCGPKATGLDSVVPQLLDMAALGNISFALSYSASLMGAEPMITRSTAEKSSRAMVSGSRTAMAIMVGTEVRI